MEFKIELACDVTPDELGWLRQTLPALIVATLELWRAGGHGREQGLITFFAADVAPNLDDVQRAARDAELIRGSATRTSRGKNNRIEDMLEAGELLEETPFLDRLGWPRSKIARAVAEKRVFFVTHEGRLFPAFYTEPAYDRRQLYSITRVLGDIPTRSKLRFFTTPRRSLAKRSPLEALLAGEFAAVKAAAEAFRRLSTRAAARRQLS